MKTLNLRLFAVAMLLAVTFATLPPYQAQAVVLMPTPEMLQQHLEKFLAKEGIEVKDIDIKALAADPQAVYKIKQAQKAFQKFAAQMYIEYGDDVKIEISTNAPPGVIASEITNGVPIVYVPPMVKSDGGIAPSYFLPTWCLYVLVCIIVGGIAYWIKVKICKALDRIFPPKTNDPSTNENDWALSSLKIASVPPTATDNELMAMSGSCETIWTTDPNPTSLYTFAVQSASNLYGVWGTSYTIYITNGFANMPFGGVGIYDGNGLPIRQQASGDCVQVLRVNGNELQPYVRLQFLPSTNYSVYPSGSPNATNYNIPMVILPPTFNIQ